MARVSGGCKKVGDEEEGEKDEEEVILKVENDTWK